MLRLAETREEISVVSDQIGSPTCAADLAEAILTILPKIKNETVEVFHYSNEGICSWFDFAKGIFELYTINKKLKPIKSIDYPTSAKRPVYSVLSKRKIMQWYNIEIPSWTDSIIHNL